MLDRLGSGEIPQTLEDCTDDFFLYEEDLNALNRAYILAHRSDFS